MTKEGGRPGQPFVIGVSAFGIPWSLVGHWWSIGHSQTLVASPLRPYTIGVGRTEPRSGRRRRSLRSPRLATRVCSMSLSVLASGIILAAVQFVAALPWLWVIDPKGFARASRSPSAMGSVVGGLVAAGLGIAAFIGYQGDS